MLSANNEAGMDIDNPARRASADNELGGAEDVVQVPASGVLVQGKGGRDKVLQILDDIAEVVDMSSTSISQSPSQSSRKYNSKNEFKELVQRIKRKDAEVVLRKLFLYRGSCNVEQEIWIKDPDHPEARYDPLKSYAIVHSHQHAQVSHVRDVKPEHLDVVDAMNVRHLAANGRGYQGDNPFFRTYIEPSGDNLKVFPWAADWTCRMCGQSNYQSKALCRGRRGASCTGSRPCTAWNWKEERSRDEGLALILESANAALQWTSGSGKSMARGSDSLAGTETFALEDLMQQYGTARAARRDLRDASDRSASEPHLCNTCKQSPCSQSCRSWCDLHAAVLCIGIGEYSDLSRLPNALRDARALQEQANAVGKCRGELLENPQDLKELSRGIKRMLNRDGLKQIPPKAILIVYCGHQTQQGAKVYFMPANANPAAPECEPEVEFLDLSLVWKFCKQLDDHARSLTPPVEILFQVLTDGCRDGEAMLEQAALGSILDPPKGEAPKRWSLTFSCTRKSVAMDGAPGEHSPFAAALLDQQTGIFAPGMPLKRAIQTAVRRLRDSAGTHGQAPFAPSLEAIDDDFCINPSDERSETPDADADELVSFLRRHNFKPAIAAQFSDAMQVTFKQFFEMTAEDLDDPELSFLKPVHKRALIALIRDHTAHALSLDETELSGADTASEGHDETSNLSGEASDLDFCDMFDCIVMRHPGNPDDFQKHMEGFLREFLESVWIIEAAIDEASETFVAPAGLPDGRLTYCMFLWMRFGRDATFDSSTKQEWLDACQYLPSQQKLLERLDVSLAQESTAHKLWVPDKFKQLDCCKEFAAAVFVTDGMVRYHVRAHGQSMRIWSQDVVGDWFKNGEDASAFLLRANRFLREHVLDDVCVVQHVVTTRSYVAFIQALQLASLLLFEYMEASKLYALKPASVGDDANETLHGFRMMVSGSGQIFSLTRADAPASGARAAVFGGLRCLARLSAQAWAVLGPTKTVREYANEIEAPVALAGSHAALNKAKDYDPDDDGSGAAAAPGSDEALNKLNAIFADDVAVNSMKAYLASVREIVSFYVDSASGERRGVDGESIPLALFSNEAFDDMCGADDAATQQDLCCPITSRIMQEPVKCSDGRTYERSAIEMWFQQHGTSPISRQTLACEPGNDTRLQHEVDVEMLSSIREFKARKNEEETQRKQDAEGEEEKRIFRQRLGLLSEHIPQEEGHGEKVESADRLLHLMLLNSGADCACLVGPPASGKTVTMLQIVFAAVRECSAKIEEGQVGVFPLFMRAAELATLLSRLDQTVEDLRQLVQLFLDDYVQKAQLERGVVNAMMELFDLNCILICIDGLDEAAAHRELIETCIDDAVVAAPAHTQTPLHVLLSTREHSYAHSRAMRRLGQFRVVKLQPLDEGHRHAMIAGRIEPEYIQDFQKHLKSSAEHNPELATSPFLLSLMIEVYKEHGTLPSQRVELYAKQVEGIVGRCVKTKIDAGHTCQVFDEGGEITSEKAMSITCEYLEALAFVCQMRQERRDFTLAACSQDLRGLWGHDTNLLADVRELLFNEPMVGLLSQVDSTTFRFSHLTLQEYLAAKCTVRHYWREANELVGQLAPFHSRWKREVLQFTACMLDEAVFEDFCERILQRDDGAGANCEIVRTFLKERESVQVQRMLSDKLLELRGADNLITGLCHPSSELRELLLSEMRQFQTPTDPFADGTAAALRAVAEDASLTWHARTAAVLSLAQVAQMEHCAHGDGRAETLRWMLKMLDTDCAVRRGIQSALTQGLGSMFRGKAACDDEQACLALAEPDNRVLLEALETMDSDVWMTVIADLNLYSTRLVDWLLSDFRSHLIERGTWPLRHVLILVERTIACASSDEVRGQISLFARLLLGRIHSLSFDASEEGPLVQALCSLVPYVGEIGPQVVDLFSANGNADQRARVLRAFGEMQAIHGERRSMKAHAVVSKAQALVEELRAISAEASMVLPAPVADSPLISHARSHSSLPPTSREAPSAPGLEAPQTVNCNQAAISSRAIIPAMQSGERSSTAGSRPSGLRGMADGSRVTQKDLYMGLHELEGCCINVSSSQFPSLLSFNGGAPSIAYICAKLWERCCLFADTFPQEIRARLSVADDGKARQAYADLQQLDHPWFPGKNMFHEQWASHVCSALQQPSAGRVIFSVVLSYVRNQFRIDPVEAARLLQALERQVEAWTPASKEEELERQLLLKELRIGRRAVDLPIWSGEISAARAEDVRGLSLVPLSVRKLGAGNCLEDVIDHVSSTEVDLSNHKTLLEVPEDLRRLSKHLRGLRIQSAQLRIMPEWLKELITVQTLNLEGCEGLAALTESVGGLTGLQTLNLERCSGLKALPESVGGLTGLQTLNLVRCRGLKALPESVGGLTGLQTLNLASCSGLKALPESVGGLTGLQTLNLEWCSGLKALPESVGGLTGLQTLNLARCEGLKALPEWVGGLTGLETLNLAGCEGLKALPEWVGGLTGLQMLNLERCSGLKALPEWVGGLTGLQTLNLASCSGLKALPESVGGLTGLQTLDLRGCSGLEALPEWVGGLTGLQTLNLARCRGLKALPEWVGGLTGLQTLNLARCRGLKALPESVGGLTGLQTMNLEGCEGLEALPKSMGGLTGLHVMGCTPRLFVQLPEHLREISRRDPLLSLLS